MSVEAVCARCKNAISFSWDYPYATCPPCRVEEAILVGICPGWSVLDVGAGLGRYHKALHAKTDGNLVLLDAHLPNIVAHKPPSDATIFIGDALKILPTLMPRIFDAVIAIDVIEHLEKSDARVLIDEMFRVAERRVLLFTPDGFMPQDKDNYNLGGDYWQTHRSGWTASELRSLGFDVERWPDLHPNGFGALWAEARVIPPPIAL